MTPREGAYGTYEVRSGRPIFAFLRLNGATSGSDNMSGTSVTTSGGPVTFAYTCPSTSRAEIARVNFTLVDGSVDQGDFGGISSGFSSGAGILIRHLSSAGSTNILFDFLQGSEIRRNRDFTWLAGTDTPISTAVGDDVLQIRWTIERSGERLLMNGGQQLAVTMRSTLTTAVTEFKGMCQGWEYPP